MADKGEKVGELTHVLRLQENDGNPNNVNQQIRNVDIDVEPKEKMVVEVDVNNQPDVDTINFVAKRYSTTEGFSIPRSVIKENSLTPGHSLDITLYELDDTTDKENEGVEFKDDAAVIDRASTRAGGHNGDSLDSRLASKKAESYIDSQGGTARIKFRNTRTKKESVGISHTDYESPEHEINFPYEVRRDLDAEHGDLIEIMTPGSEQLTDTDKIDEIHDMVSEMYDSYLETIND